MRQRLTKFVGALVVTGIIFSFAGAMKSAEAKELNNLTAKEKLGKHLYFDDNLSEPVGQSCASCHHPFSGFADPDSAIPVSQGVIIDRFGNRNSPISAYAAYSPEFHWNPDEELYFGGQFWDGRAANLTEQAKGPFLNPVEMNNPDEITVIKKIKRSNYAGLFAQVCKNSQSNVDDAYQCMAEAIAAFEMTSELNQFSSKFDCFAANVNDVSAIGMSSWESFKGKGLNDRELRGLALFNDENAANCAACHPSTPPADGSAPGAVFTDFSYDNLGVPANPELLALPGNAGFVDLGLGGSLGETAEDGKVKVMTLRNIARSAPYMHNGIFNTLHEVVDFYNTRDVDSKWPPPEVAENINIEELGSLGLSDDEVDDIVEFLTTLTDGYICQ